MKRKFPPVRRLFRFSVRSLFLLVTVVAVWLAVHIQRTKVQREGVAAIRDYGGWVRYDYQFPSGEFSYKDFDPLAGSWVPPWLIDELGIDFFHNVVQVNLNYSTDSGGRQENDNPTDDALEHLPAFPDLRVLLLADKQARDDSLRHLAGLRRLERLYMWDVTAVTDNGAAHLRDLRNLRYVHISRSRITDKSLALFARLPKLEGLSLQFNNFRYDGFQRRKLLLERESPSGLHMGKE